MDGSATLIFGMLFGAIGLGYFAYGKKQQRGLPLFCGFILMVLPYVITNILAMILIGLILMVLPYFLPY